MYVIVPTIGIGISVCWPSSLWLLVCILKTVLGDFRLGLLALLPTAMFGRPPGSSKNSFSCDFTYGAD